MQNPDEIRSSPPTAAARPHTVRSQHGDRVDPYFWLRDDERADPDVLQYLRAENAYCAGYFAPIKASEEAIYGEIIGRLKQDDSTVPYRKQGFWYYTRFEPAKEHPVFARRGPSADSPEQIMLDANALAVGHEYYQVGALEVSPDGRWLAYCEDTVGRRQYSLRIKNLESGETLPEAIGDVETDVAWANDNRTVLYVEKDPETLLGLRVKKHLVGTDPRADLLVFEQTDTTLYTGVTKSKSDRFIFIHMEGTLSSEWRYACADDSKLEFKVFLPQRRGHEYEIEDLDDRFIIRTNWQAQNFRLMWVPPACAGVQAEWRDLMPHREDTYIEDFELFSRHVAVSVRSGGLRRIVVQPLPARNDPEWLEPAGTAAAYFIPGDEAACTMTISANPELDSGLLRYTYSSLATPATVYDYDMQSGERTLLKRDPVQGGFDPARYETEFLWAPARDGTHIPVSLIHRKDFIRDGAAPLLQYGYGAYGLSMDPGFSSARFSLIDRGFVYAIAHIRGGQELGRAWYDDGRQSHKTNSFTDFIDVTHYLVGLGIARRDAVFAMGGSAGGLLMGAVANSSPQDYRGIVAQVPFVDVLTTMLDDGIPLTTNEYDEWGNPAERAAYDYILSYSPYDNVRAQDYPAMLVTTGLWDSQVQYYEPAKWVARLRACKTDHNPLLLHVDMEAGHGGKSGRFQRYRETAMIYAFLLSLAGKT
jgi:oligopeptidase B